MGIIQRNKGQNRAGRPEISAEMAATRIRQQFGQAATNIQQTLNRVKMLTDRVGKKKLVAALGADGAELENTYKAFRQLLASVDPDAEVPDL